MRTGSKDKAAKWIAAHPEEWAFMCRAPKDTFAGRVLNGVRVFGSLTDDQLAAVRKQMAESRYTPARSPRRRATAAPAARQA